MRSSSIDMLKALHQRIPASGLGAWVSSAAFHIVRHTIRDIRELRTAKLPMKLFETADRISRL